MEAPLLSPGFFQLFDAASSLESAYFLYGIFLSALFFCAFLIYVLFALVAVRQIYLMDATIKTPLSPVLKLVGWAHLFVSIFIASMVFVAL